MISISIDISIDDEGFQLFKPIKMLFPDILNSVSRGWLGALNAALNAGMDTYQHPFLYTFV